MFIETDKYCARCQICAFNLSKLIRSALDIFDMCSELDIFCMHVNARNPVNCVEADHSSAKVMVRGPSLDEQLKKLQLITTVLSTGRSPRNTLAGSSLSISGVTDVCLLALSLITSSPVMKFDARPTDLCLTEIIQTQRLLYPYLGT